MILDEPEVLGRRVARRPTRWSIRLVVQTEPLEQWRVERELRARIKAALDDGRDRLAVGVAAGSRTAREARPAGLATVRVRARCSEP